MEGSPHSLGNRYQAGTQPLPPTPSPRRRGGAERETHGLSPPLRFGEGAGGRGCLSPPLRFGEGVGGRGCYQPRITSRRTSRSVERLRTYMVATPPDSWRSDVRSRLVRTR